MYYMLVCMHTFCYAIVYGTTVEVNVDVFDKLTCIQSPIIIHLALS